MTFSRQNKSSSLLLVILPLFALTAHHANAARDGSNHSAKKPRNAKTLLSLPHHAQRRLKPEEMQILNRAQNTPSETMLLPDKGIRQNIKSMRDAIEKNPMVLSTHPNTILTLMQMAHEERKPLKRIVTKEEWERRYHTPNEPLAIEYVRQALTKGYVLYVNSHLVPKEFQELFTRSPLENAFTKLEDYVGEKAHADFRLVITKVPTGQKIKAVTFVREHGPNISKLDNHLKATDANISLRTLISLFVYAHEGMTLRGLPKNNFERNLLFANRFSKSLDKALKSERLNYEQAISILENGYSDYSSADKERLIKILSDKDAIENAKNDTEALGSYLKVLAQFKAN